MSQRKSPQISGPRMVTKREKSQHGHVIEAGLWLPEFVGNGDGDTAAYWSGAALIRLGVG